MKDGWWLNYDTGNVFEIDEHERWIRRGNNANLLGVPEKIQIAFSKYTPAQDRDAFITYVIMNSPVIRVRGHGSYCTFEYATPPFDIRPFKTILDWGRSNAGPALLLNINNLRTGGNVSEPWQDYCNRFAYVESE